MRKLKLHYIIPALILLIGSFYFIYDIYLKIELLTVYDVETTYMLDPQEADISILEFGQYNCGTCRIIHSSLKAALAKDGKVRYIPRPVSYGDVWAETLSRAVYAAALQEKFIQMHNAIYEKGPIDTREDIFILARQVGLDIVRFEQDMESEEVSVHIQENDAFYKAWALQTVPAFLINKKILYRPNEQEMPTVDIWLDKFDRAREK